MKLATGYETQGARIEMIPLLDVVFLLLVSFIYAMLSVTVHHEVDVVLPKSTDGIRSESTRPVIITLTRQDQLLVDGQELSLAAVVDVAVQRMGTGGTQVLIYGDREANLGVAIELLSKLRSAGIEAASFLVEEEQ
jgi:biopolymer transport protein ExbD